MVVAVEEKTAVFLNTSLAGSNSQPAAGAVLVAGVVVVVVVVGAGVVRMLVVETRGEARAVSKTPHPRGLASLYGPNPTLHATAMRSGRGAGWAGCSWRRPRGSARWPRPCPRRGWATLARCLALGLVHARARSALRGAGRALGKRRAGQAGCGRGPSRARRRPGAACFATQARPVAPP